MTVGNISLEIILAECISLLKEWYRRNISTYNISQSSQLIINILPILTLTFAIPWDFEHLFFSHMSDLKIQIVVTAQIPTQLLNFIVSIGDVRSKTLIHLWKARAHCCTRLAPCPPQPACWRFGMSISWNGLIWDEAIACGGQR
jgi:hypothetical protein